MQRYEQYANVITGDDKKRRYSTMYYPVPPKKSSDIYIIVKNHDRLDILADRYYGDPRKWVLLAKANKLHAGTIRVPAGIRLWIPYPYNNSDIEEQFGNKQL